MLVLHYTGMPTAEEALARLCDPEAKVSSHYTIDEAGVIYRHVPEERRAWHSGVSFWAGEANVNGRSIGIELINPGHEFGYVPFAEPQIAALIELAQGILVRHHIPARFVLGHSDVAPARKTDPGELFPWQRLAKAGVGVWPAAVSPGRNTGPERIAAQLSQFGYGVPPLVDVPIDAVIGAFQRHFRPAKIDGIWDDECAGLLDALVSDDE